MEGSAKHYKYRQARPSLIHVVKKRSIRSAMDDGPEIFSHLPSAHDRGAGQAAGVVTIVLRDTQPGIGVMENSGQKRLSIARTDAGRFLVLLPDR
ncbi:hypothetical protein TELCIR_02448 [Teladorsagia circumcincta]|uniref:Uncharacterized protein n=1 Tax=Teladorsagia circumcincta TaxID=45464 RepID=A0A2G9V176_TELCI|nr:hypothetical protein TELCIR_02448 [Teladorsagia circumcincta]